MGSADEFSLSAVDGVAENPPSGRAVREHLFAAIDAFAASTHAGYKDAISRLEHRDSRPNLFNDANTLMAENAAGLAGRDITLEDVQIGPADRRLCYFDDRIGWRRDFWFWTIFQSFFAGPPIN